MLKVMAVEQRQRETQRPEPGSQMPECVFLTSSILFGFSFQL